MTTVASHNIFFDPGPTENVIGTVNFDSDVLAILTSTTRLADTDFLTTPTQRRARRATMCEC